MLLSIRHLTFGWSDPPLFRDLSAELEEGSIVQLSGENGAGKTTLLRLIAGMIPHFSRGAILTGDILLMGESAIKHPPRHFFPTIAFVPGQHIDFFTFTENMTEEILFIRAVRNLEKKDVDEKMELFTSFFPHVERLMHAPFRTLHDDQKALTLLLIYFLQGARLFLLDEIFRDNEEPYFSFMRLLAAQKCGVIFTGHHVRRTMDDVWKLC